MYQALNWFYVAISTGVSFLLTLLLPKPWYLLPALFLCPMAPLMAMRQIRQPWRHRDWAIYPAGADLSRMRGFCIDPELLIGQRGVTAEVWMPFEPMPAERFRSRSGAVALAAAAALISGHLPPDPDEPSTHLEPAKWLASLGIQPENFKRVNPFLDEATYHGYRGVVVADGPGERAYFCGGAAIVQRCAQVLDGVARPLLPADRERLSQVLPPDVLCYATAPVAEGRLGELCFLGAIRPSTRCTPSHEALQAGEAVQRMGYHIVLSTIRQSSLQAVQAMGIDWPEDDGSPDLLELRARHEPDAQTRRFDLALESLLRYDDQERKRRILAAWLGLLLWPCATLCASQWPLVAGLLCCCAGILLSRRLPVPIRRGFSWQTLAIASVPGVLIPVLTGLLLPRLSQTAAAIAGGMMLMAEASFWALSFSWPSRHQPLPGAAPAEPLGTPLDSVLTPLRERMGTGMRPVLLTALCCLAGFLFVFLLSALMPASAGSNAAIAVSAGGKLMSALLGLVAGVVTAACVLWLSGLTARSDRLQS